MAHGYPKTPPFISKTWDLLSSSDRPPWIGEFESSSSVVAKVMVIEGYSAERVRRWLSSGRAAGTWLLEKLWSAPLIIRECHSRRDFSFCPECAKKGYHSELMGLCGLRRCPYDAADIIQIAEMGFRTTGSLTIFYNREYGRELLEKGGYEPAGLQAIAKHMCEYPAIDGAYQPLFKWLRKTEKVSCCVQGRKESLTFDAARKILPLPRLNRLFPRSEIRMFSHYKIREDVSAEGLWTPAALKSVLRHIRRRYLVDVGDREEAKRRAVAYRMCLSRFYSPSESLTSGEPGPGEAICARIDSEMPRRFKGRIGPMLGGQLMLSAFFHWVVIPKTRGRKFEWNYYDEQYLGKMVFGYEQSLHIFLPNSLALLSKVR